MTTEPCYLCGSTLMIEWHHTVPRALGGHDSRLVPLCKECHALVHLVVRKVLSGRSAEAEALAGSKSLDRRRLQELVRTAVEAHYVRFRRVPLDNPQEVRVTLPRAVRAAAKRAARDHGLTLDQFILNAVLKELRRLGWCYGQTESGSSREVVPTDEDGVG